MWHTSETLAAAGDSKGSVDVKDVPSGPPTVKGTKDLKKITDVVKAFQNGQGDAANVEKLVNKTIDVVNKVKSESDTTVTAKFADKIETTDGTLILSSTKDSTATISKKDVSDFNEQAETSVKKQNQEVNKLLDNQR